MSATGYEKLAAVAALVFLAGCTPTADRPVKVYEVGSFRQAREWHLDDGTRCVSMRESGITCDWRGLKQ